MADAARRILLVEDHEETRMMYRTLLEQAGWQVAEAADGRAALERVGDGGFALVLMDISLPGIDGWEATRRIRQRGSVPVLLVTAHALDDDRDRGRRVGASGYLVKPIPPTRLLEEVERLAAAPPERP